MILSRIPRKMCTKKRGLTFSNLNDDVVFEIFLNFVAIDWDGPFTLLLVCTKWRCLVMSKPRLWTWIMIADTRPDWKERVDVAASLSKGLPLQIVLRLPFSSETSMAYLTQRCTTLIVECPYLYRDGWLSLQPSFTIVPYDYFNLYRTMFNDMADSMIKFLRNAPMERIQILSGDKDRAAFAYSMWTIQEGVMGGGTIDDLLVSSSSVPITDLRFSQPGRPTTKIQLSELWRVLPSLCHLNYLEVGDDAIEWNQEALPPISLLQLETLIIKSLVVDGLSFRLGLFDLLESLSAPQMETLILYGPIRRILGSIGNTITGVRPRKLTVDISTFEGIDIFVPEATRVWYMLQTLTICISSSTKAFSRIPADKVAVVAQALSSFPPKACSTHIHLGGEEAGIYPLGVSNLTANASPIHSYNKLTSFAASIASARGSLLFQTHIFTESVVVQNQQIITKLLHFTYIPLFYPRYFSASVAHLQDLRCSPHDADLFISLFELKTLRVLTLKSNLERRGIKGLAMTLTTRAETLPLLTTIRLQDVDIWRSIIMILGNLNKSSPHGGITALEVSGLPHPIILRERVTALKSGPEGYKTRYLDREQSSFRPLGSSNCWNCFQSGWICVEGRECTRFSVEIMIYITKDTIISGLSDFSILFIWI